MTRNPGVATSRHRDIAPSLRELRALEGRNLAFLLFLIASAFFRAISPLKSVTESEVSDAFSAKLSRCDPRGLTIAQLPAASRHVHCRNFVF
jgi:hypothetical protein